MSLTLSLTRLSQATLGKHRKTGEVLISSEKRAGQRAKRWAGSMTLYCFVCQVQPALGSMTAACNPAGPCKPADLLWAEGKAACLTIYALTLSLSVCSAAAGRWADHGRPL